MPRLCVPSEDLAWLLERQDGVISRDQALARGLTARALHHRVATGRWQRLLPCIYLAHNGEPSRRQRVLGAWLWAGDESAVDGASAYHWYGITPSGLDENRVHLVVPIYSFARTQSFVTVRRTRAPIVEGGRTVARYVDPATAALVAARHARSVRDAVAALSRPLQMGIVDVDDLRLARAALGGRGYVKVDEALRAVGAGARSAAELDTQALIRSSRILPEPLWNCLLRLPGGELFSPDALWPDAALIHETNGRLYHAWANAFSDMQRRHDVLTAAGLTVLHNTPHRQLHEGGAVVREIETCYLRNLGRGLPPGVEIVRR